MISFITLLPVSQVVLLGAPLISYSWNMILYYCRTMQSSQLMKYWVNKFVFIWKKKRLIFFFFFINKTVYGSSYEKLSFFFLDRDEV